MYVLFFGTANSVLLMLHYMERQVQHVISNPMIAGVASFSNSVLLELIGATVVQRQSVIMGLVPLLINTLCCHAGGWVWSLFRLTKFGTSSSRYFAKSIYFVALDV